MGGGLNECGEPSGWGCWWSQCWKPGLQSATSSLGKKKGMGLFLQKSVGEKSVKFAARVGSKEGAVSGRGGRSERRRARPKLGRGKDQVVVSVGGQEGQWQRGRTG